MLLRMHGGSCACVLPGIPWLLHIPGLQAGHARFSNVHAYVIFCNSFLLPGLDAFSPYKALWGHAHECLA